LFYVFSLFITSRFYCAFLFYIYLHGVDEWKSVLSLLIIFQEDTDKSFIKKHQVVVKQQTTQWANSEAGITGALIDMNPYFPKEYGFEPTEPTLEENKKPNIKSGKFGSGSPASHLSRPPSGRPLGSKVGAAAGDGSGKSNVENGESSEQGTMSAETLAALPGALKEIFARHHVCRYST
jgi:hypothetical protein